jgi:hypothetical protein
MNCFAPHIPSFDRQLRVQLSVNDWNGRVTGDEDEDDDDEPDNSLTSFGSLSSDWTLSEFTLRTIPTEPNPELTAETVTVACCRSLQWVDYPSKSAGLIRCYDFFTFECRKAVTARQGGGSPERFCQYGLLSPALQPFYGASRIEIGNATYTPAQPPLRGALASFPILIQGAPVLALQHPSGMDRQGVSSAPPITHMVIRLEQQRRPPQQGCWLVREVLDVRHAFAGDLGNAGVGG